MRSLTDELKQVCALAGIVAAGVLASGCSHLTYTDPNPSTPYAFPGQGSSKGSAGAPASAGGASSVWHPAPNVAVYGTPSAGTPSPYTPPAPAPAPVAYNPPPTPTPAAYNPPPVPQPNPQPTLAPVGIQAQPTIAPPAISGAPAGPGGTVSYLTVGETVTISWSDLPPPGWAESKIRIGEDGKIILPFNVTVMAAGKTANQLAEDIRKEYVPRYFVRITPTVKTEERFYFVGGEVKIPARQPYLGEMTVLRAIDTAGGFTDFADRDHIELRRQNGAPQIVKWSKIIKGKESDPQVFPNDQITVHKRPPFKLFGS